MNVSSHVPAWAQSQVQSFRDSQTLPGGQKMPLNAAQAREADGKLSQQVDQGILLDESEMDDAKGELGVIRADLFGTKTEVYFEGDSKSGEFVQTVGDEMAVYGKFSPEQVDVVVSQKDGENVNGQAFRIDRKEPGNSFAIMQGAGGFNFAA